MSNRLEDLLANGSSFSGGALAQELGISRTAVFKRIAVLRRSGYLIEADPNNGYRLVPRFDGLLPLEIRLKNHCRSFGREVSVLESTGSTQVALKELAERGAGEGALVVALEQSSGKGRMGHPWSSPKGGLWFSLLLRPTFRLPELYKITLLFGIAVARALEHYGISPKLKWPNDVLVEEKKICGMLMETSLEADKIDYVVVGIGINVNFHTAELVGEIRTAPTSMLDLMGKQVDRAGLLALVLAESEALYYSAEAQGFSSIMNAWRSLSCTIGREVSVSSFGRTMRGRAVDIDDDGSLVVLTEGGKKEKIYTGDVTFV